MLLAGFLSNRFQKHLESNSPRTASLKGIHSHAVHSVGGGQPSADDCSSADFVRRALLDY